MYDGVSDKKWNEISCKKFFIERMNHEAELLSKINPDVIVMCGWRQIISEEILSIPKSTFVAFHPTLLPWGRGPAPIINTILEGATESGVTLFHVSPDTDRGDVIDQDRFLIDPKETATTLYEKAIESGKKLIENNLDKIVEGTSSRYSQDESKAFTFKKLKLSDNEIDLYCDSVDLIDRKIRALAKPYLGAFIRVGNKKIIIERGLACIEEKES